MVNISLWVSGAVTRRSRLIDRGSLLPPHLLQSHNPRTGSAEVVVRCRSGPGKAKPQAGRISVLAGLEGRLQACMTETQLFLSGGTCF